jgi:hypothetical protein
MRPHILPQPGIQKFAGAPWLTGSGDRLDLRRTGAIGVTAGQTQAQGLTVFSTQVRVALFCIATP